MSVSYNPITGIAYSDAQDFETWKYEIGLQREAWADVILKRVLPHSVYVAANKKKSKKSQAFAETYLKQNGYRMVDIPENLTNAIVHNGKIISVYKVSLQPPDRHKCRICGGPTEPSQREDLCGNCDLENRLAAKFQSIGMNRSDVVK